MTSEKTAPTNPGPLRSRTILQVQIRKAHALVRGRRQDGAKPAIIGLVRFAALLGPIYAAAARDDPWADWWLIKVERLLDEGGRLVRRAFHAADGYRHLAVSREDVRQGTARGQRARETLGELPQEVLEGTLRAEHAPAIGRLESEPIADAPAWSEDDREDLESKKSGAAGRC